VNPTRVRPAIGGQYRAIVDHSFTAGVDARLISVRRGTTLEVTRADETWDNHHPDIVRWGQVEVTLRIIDGPSVGEEIAVRMTAESLPPDHDQEATTWNLPYWLVPATHA
jgi:hypothetical protein